MRNVARVFLPFALLLLLVPAAVFPGPEGEGGFRRANSFAGSTLDGRVIALDSMYAGKPFVVLTFFGVNCIPCQKKIAQLNELFRDESFLASASLYAVNADGLAPDALRKELDRRKIKIDFPVVPDENQAITNLFVDGIVPLTIVIDNEYRIVMSTLGARPEAMKKMAEWIRPKQGASNR